MQEGGPRRSSRHPNRASGGRWRTARPAPAGRACGPGRVRVPQNSTRRDGRKRLPPLVNDERKRRKLEEEFMPRTESALVALAGSRCQHVALTVRYQMGQGLEYESVVTVEPHTGKIVQQPRFGQCAKTRKIAFEDALGQCDISGAIALRHVLDHVGCQWKKGSSGTHSDMRA